MTCRRLLFALPFLLPAFSAGAEEGLHPFDSDYQVVITGRHGSQMRRICDPGHTVKQAMRIEGSTAIMRIKSRGGIPDHFIHLRIDPGGGITGSLQANGFQSLALSGRYRNGRLEAEVPDSHCSIALVLTPVGDQARPAPAAFKPDGRWVLTLQGRGGPNSFRRRGLCQQGDSHSLTVTVKDGRLAQDFPAPFGGSTQRLSARVGADGKLIGSLSSAGQPTAKLNGSLQEGRRISGHFSGGYCKGLFGMVRAD